MNRYSLLILACCVSLISVGQINILPFDTIVDLPTDRMQRISAEGWADYNSSSVYNELPWNIYQGGYIDRDLRQRSREVLQSSNSAGYDVGARLTWIGSDSLFGRSRMRPIVSVAYRNMMGVRFAPDVYELAFFGNAHYEDRTADLSSSAHSQITWQSAGFGIQDVPTRSFIRLDLLRGRAFNAGEIRRGELYTAPDGRLLELDMDATYWSSDTAGRDEKHTNGVGASISGKWNLLRSIAGRPSILSLSIEDAGFMYWNDNSIRVERDTVLSYEGLRLENIFSLGEILVGEEQLLDSLGLGFQRGSYTTLLPIRAAMAIDMEISDRWRAGLSLDYRYLPGYRPQVILSASRRFGERVLLGTSTAYGGFGVFRFGLATRIRLGEFMLIELGTTHIPGFFIGETHGAGAYAGLSVGF